MPAAVDSHASPCPGAHMSIILNPERAWLHETYSFQLVSEMQKHLLLLRDTMWAEAGVRKKRNAKWICWCLWVLLKFHRSSSVTSTWPVPFVSRPWTSLQVPGTVVHHRLTHCRNSWDPGLNPQCPTCRRFSFWRFNRCHQPRRGDSWQTRGFLLPEAHWPASVKGPNLSVGKEF